MKQHYSIIGPNSFPRIEGAEGFREPVVRLQIYGEQLMSQQYGVEITLEADEAMAMAMELIRHVKTIQRQELIKLGDEVVAGIAAKDGT